MLQVHHFAFELVGFNVDEGKLRANVLRQEGEGTGHPDLTNAYYRHFAAGGLQGGLDLPHKFRLDVRHGCDLLKLKKRLVFDSQILGLQIPM